MSRLVFTRRSLKDLRKLESTDARRIVEGLERFASDAAGDVKKLKDVDPPEWRLRVGHYRARFRYEPDTNRLVVLRVLPRDKAY